MMNLSKSVVKTVKPMISMAVMAAILPASPLAEAQESVASQLRPLGAPSAVDRYTNSSSSVSSESASTGDFQRQSIRGRQPLTSPAFYRQNDGSFTGAVQTQYDVRQAQYELPPSGFGGGTTEPRIQGVEPVPPNGLNLPNSPASGGLSPGNSFSGSAVPNATTPRNLPNPNFQAGPSQSIPQTRNLQTLNPQLGTMPMQSDLVPMRAPQLGAIDSNGFATLGNSQLVTQASCYSAAMAPPSLGCGPAIYGPAAVLPPQSFQTAPPVAAAGVPLGAISTNPGPIGPLLTFGQERFPVQVGQGIIGQPKAYVEGQKIRNFLRYFTP